MRSAGWSAIPVPGSADRVVAAVEPLSGKDWMLVTVTFPFGEKEGDAIRRCGVSTQRRGLTTGAAARIVVHLQHIDPSGSWLNPKSL
jgi:hypothetical protein